MKNLFLTSLTLFVFSFINAQNPALPNAGFEFWTQAGNHYDPNNWNTLNPNTSILGVLTAVRATGADVHSGTYAIKLITKSVFGQIANGIASTGTIITTPPYGVVGGIPYTGRPDSIAGWYKYTPVSTDSGFVEFILKGHNHDTIGYVRFVTPNATVSTYTRFSAKINYYSSANPDTSVWILSSSRGSNPVVNSTLFVDDLQLIFNPIVCNPPGNLSTVNITASGAKLKWAAVPGAISYQQKYRVVGTTAWTIKASTGLNKVLAGLAPGTTYEWAVRAKCSINPVTWSAYSVKKTFTTLSAREDEDATLENENYSLNLFPNPASEMVNISMMTDGDEIFKLSVYNAIGQLVMTTNYLASDGLLNEQLNLSGYKNGIYMITVDGNQIHSTRKLLKQ